MDGNIYKAEITERPQLYSSRDGVYPIGFNVFYSDRSIFKAQGSMEELYEKWKKAPKENVQVVMVFENTISATGKHTKANFSGADYYFFDGKVFGATNDTRTARGHILYGRWTAFENFSRINKMAMEKGEVG